MFADLKVFQMAGAMAEHAGHRQAVIAKNIANSDVPGYKAMDIKGFAEVFEDFSSGAMKSSRPGHVNFSEYLPAPSAYVQKSSAADPNGNTVTVETEIMKSAESKLQHDMALQIYSHGLKVLRASLGGR